MMGKTHAVAGAALGALAGSMGPIPYISAAAGAVVGAVAALLPDIDHPGSKVGRWLRPVAVWLEWRFGHRESPTHTLLFAALAGLVLGMLALPLVGVLAPLAGVMGGISHLALDACTKSGVAPLRPWSEKKYRGPLVTGGVWEAVTAAVSLLVLAAALLV